MKSELKWQKITNQKEAEYREIIDYFFDLKDANLLHFHSLIVPYRFDHKAINNNDKNLGLHKMQLPVNSTSFLQKLWGARERTIHIPRPFYKALRWTRRSRMLNRGVRKHYGIAHNPVREIEPLDSAECNLLQINDVILGAVCAHRNLRHLKVGGKEAKRRLAEYALQRTGLNSYQNDTAITGLARFTIWNLRSSLLRNDRSIHNRWRSHSVARSA